MKKVLGVLFGVALGVPILAFGLIESGEVIVLRTSPEDGGEFLARLWVVDHDGDPWVGKMDPSEARWVRRLETLETASIVRDGRAECRVPVFVSDPEVQQTLYAIYMEKYRIPLYGARTLGFLFGGNPDPAEAARSAILVRLAPCADRGS